MVCGHERAKHVDGHKFTGCNTKGAIIKDASWLQPIKNTQHISMVELDTILRGVNLTLK